MKLVKSIKTLKVKRQMLIPVELYSIKSIKTLRGISFYDILYNLIENLR